MLIPSPRHTPADLALWAELEDADHAVGASMRLYRQVGRAMAAIRTFASRGPCYLGISWGKDSVALAALAREGAPGVPLVWMRYSVPNPDCALVRDAYFRDFPGQTYHELDAPPERTRGQKLQRFDIAADLLGTSRYLSGVRADESGIRKLSIASLGLLTDNVARPIGWWTTAEVFGFLASRNLPVHPAYACLGGGRWPREHLRVASLTGQRGRGHGRDSWEREYYGEMRAGRTTGETTTRATGGERG